MVVMVVAAKVQNLITMAVVVGVQYLMVVFVLELHHLMMVVVFVEHILQNKYYPIHIHFEMHQNMV